VRARVCVSLGVSTFAIRRSFVMCVFVCVCVCVGGWVGVGVGVGVSTFAIRRSFVVSAPVAPPAHWFCSVTPATGTSMGCECVSAATHYMRRRIHVSVLVHEEEDTCQCPST